MRAVIPTKSRSTIVMAAMDSTTTTARGIITGSWRPLISICTFSPSRFTVSCGWKNRRRWLGMRRGYNIIPSLMPPKIPPAKFVCFSLCHPLPYRNRHYFRNHIYQQRQNRRRFQHLLPHQWRKIAADSIASNLPKTGSPIPAGMPLITHSIIPPTESCASIFLPDNLQQEKTFSKSGMRSGLFQCSPKTSFLPRIQMVQSALCSSYGNSSSLKIFMAMAPAATSSNSLTPGGTSTASVIAESVFGIKRKIRMGPDENTFAMLE